MVLVGSIIGFENSQQFGCVIGLEMLSLSNVIFLMIALVLLIGINKSENIETKFFLCKIEFGIWIGKYFLYKGGYIFGFSGEPNLLNVTYDFIAIGLRMFLLMTLLGTRKNYLIPSVLLAVIILLKINCFALPWYTSYVWSQEEELRQDQRIELVTKYSGEIINLENQRKSELSIRIDKSRMLFLNKSFKVIKHEYQFDIEYPDFGMLRTKEGKSFQVDIQKMDGDSLIFYLENWAEKEYLVSLKNERFQRNNKIRSK